MSATGATGRPITLGVDPKGLCEVGRKCIKKARHEGDCWPKDLHSGGVVADPEVPIPEGCVLPIQRMAPVDPSILEDVRPSGHIYLLSKGAEDGA